MNNSDALDGSDLCGDRPGDTKRKHLRYQKGLKLTDDDFSRYDRDDNGRITGDELQVVLIQSTPKPASSGASRPTCHSSVETLRLDGIEIFGEVIGRVTYCQSIVSAQEGVGFMTLAHELAHQLGTVDIYVPLGRQRRLSADFTLMSSIIRREDTHRRFHLDPWHKIQLGWAEPQIDSVPELRREGRCGCRRGEEKTQYGIETRVMTYSARSPYRVTTGRKPSSVYYVSKGTHLLNISLVIQILVSTVSSGTIFRLEFWGTVYFCAPCRARALRHTPNREPTPCGIS